MPSFCVAREDLIKPAALLFDKVRYARSVTAYEEVPAEIVLEVSHAEIEIARADATRAVEDAAKYARSRTELDEALRATFLRRVVAAYARQNVFLVPLYESESRFAYEFPEGVGIAYQAVINNLPVVSPNLEWEQVLEFRRDEEATYKYRAMRRWIRDALMTGSVQEATDLLAVRIADYQWAIQKHGLKTLTGALSAMISSRTIAAAAAAGGMLAILQQPSWALLTSGALTLGSAAVWLAERRIEYVDYRRANAAIAMIVDIDHLVRGGGRKGNGKRTPPNLSQEQTGGLASGPPAEPAPALPTGRRHAGCSSLLSSKSVVAATSAPPRLCVCKPPAAQRQSR